MCDGSSLLFVEPTQRYILRCPEFGNFLIVNEGIRKERYLCVGRMQGKPLTQEKWLPVIATGGNR